MSIQQEHIAIINNSIDNARGKIDNIEFYLKLPEGITTLIDLKVIGRESIKLYDSDIFNVIAEKAKKVLYDDLKKLLKIKAAIVKIDDE